MSGADPAPRDAGLVRAAGGVVWRRAADHQGPVEILVVHRPKYDDWSLPKGKAEPGESDEECAVREVEEETGLRCRLGRELPGVAYEDRFGRPKTVRYWTMEPESGAFTGRFEVDEVRWLPVADAAEMLTYDRDVGVVRAFADQHAASG